MSRTTADAIRAAALRILETEGPEAVSLRRVATAVGITPMAIYHHFASREAMDIRGLGLAGGRRCSIAHGIVRIMVLPA